MLDFSAPFFREQIVIATAASVEGMNAHHRAEFAEQAIVAPWDPRGLAAEFAWLEIGEIGEEVQAVAARFAGSAADAHAAALQWARQRLAALWPGVSAELLDGRAA